MNAVVVDACKKLEKQANLLMIFILFGEGKEVERVYRLSMRECREEVRRGDRNNSILGDGNNSFHQH